MQGQKVYRILNLQMFYTSIWIQIINIYIYKKFLKQNVDKKVDKFEYVCSTYLKYIQISIISYDNNFKAREINFF